MLHARHHRGTARRRQAARNGKSMIAVKLPFSTARKITDSYSAPSPCHLPRGARGHWTVISRTVLTGRTAPVLSSWGRVGTSQIRAAACVPPFSMTRNRRDKKHRGQAFDPISGQPPTITNRFGRARCAIQPGRKEKRHRPTRLPAGGKPRLSCCALSVPGSCLVRVEVYDSAVGNPQVRSTTRDGRDVVGHPSYVG